MNSTDDLDDETGSLYGGHAGKTHSFDDENDFSDWAPVLVFFIINFLLDINHLSLAVRYKTI